jgi:hypothetical protein
VAVGVAPNEAVLAQLRWGHRQTRAAGSGGTPSDSVTMRAGPKSKSAASLAVTFAKHSPINADGLAARRT